jgi:hypothetical protein
MAALEKSIGQADRSPILNDEIFIRRAKYATKNISFIEDVCHGHGPTAKASLRRGLAAG